MQTTTTFSNGITAINKIDPETNSQAKNQIKD